VAWAGEADVISVDMSADGGETWQRRAIPGSRSPIRVAALDVRLADTVNARALLGDLASHGCGWPRSACFAQSELRQLRDQSSVAIDVFVDHPDNEPRPAAERMNISARPPRRIVILPVMCLCVVLIIATRGGDQRLHPAD